MRAHTVFAVCPNDFPCTEPTELRGELVVVNHDTMDAEVVAGAMRSSEADLEALAECCREAIVFIQKLKKEASDE